MRVIVRFSRLHLDNPQGGSGRIIEEERVLELPRNCHDNYSIIERVKYQLRYDSDLPVFGNHPDCVPYILGIEIAL